MPRLHLTAYVFALGLLLCGAQVAQAQGAEQRWEAGGQFSVFDVASGRSTAVAVECVKPPCPLGTTRNINQRATEPGFGGRIGYSVNRYFTVEAEANYFPRERALTDPDFTGGRKWQGLFGVKVGRRYDRVGVFAKARPGFVNFKEGDLRDRAACVALFPPPLACFQAEGRTDFAFDVGGVFELYPSAHTAVRFDAGDTVLRTRAHNVPAEIQFSPSGPVFLTVLASPAATTHNFQGSVGFGFRF